MTRSLSQLCYAALMMVSRLVIFTACLSVTVTFIASCTLNDSQLDSLTDVVRNMTKMLSYIGITVGSFLLGAAFNRIQRERKQKKEQQHAAVLQAATRRRLSRRSTSAPKTPPATLSVNIDSPPKRRSTRLRGRATRLEFDTPPAPVPMERRASMDGSELQW